MCGAFDHLSAGEGRKRHSAAYGLPAWFAAGKACQGARRARSAAAPLTGFPSRDSRGPEPCRELTNRAGAAGECLRCGADNGELCRDPERSNGGYLK